MLTRNYTFYKTIETITLIFVVFQVHINLLTTASLQLFKFDLSFGMVIRALFLIFIITVLVFFGTKRIRLLSLLSLLPFAFRLVRDVLIGRENLLANVRYLTRAAFFPFCVLWFFYLFLNRKSNTRLRLAADLLAGVSITVLLSSLVIIIAGLTGTGIDNYNEIYRDGISGWFLSGNEIASFFAASLGIPAFMLYQRFTAQRLLTLVFQVFAIFLLGTKTSFVMMVVVLLFCAIILAKHSRGFTRSTRMAMFAGLAVLSVLILLFIPATQNTIRQIQRNNLIKEIKSLSATDTPSKKVQKSMNRTPADDQGTALYSIRLANSADGVKLTGYFYPEFMDITVPSQVEMAIIFSEKNQDPANGKTIKITNAFNPNISHARAAEYNSFFAGITADIPATLFKMNHSYKIFVKVQSQAIDRIYPIDLRRVVLSSTGDAPYELVKRSGQISAEAVAAPAPPKPQKPAPNTGTIRNTKLPVWMRFLLSNRDARLQQFINAYPRSFKHTLVFGSGYLANSGVKQGNQTIYSLELDIIESVLVFGFPGFIIIYLPFFALIFLGIATAFRKWRRRFFLRPDMIFLMSSLLLTLVYGFFVGHMFLLPSTSLFIGIIVNVFCIMSNAFSGQMLNNRKRKV